MFRTVAQCKAAIADCEARIRILKASLTDVSARPESRKRERLIEIANNTVGFLELQLESLRQDLGKRGGSRRSGKTTNKKSPV